MHSIGWTRTWKHPSKPSGPDKFTLSRGNSQASGNVSLQARAGSFDDAAISGAVTLANISLEEADKEIGRMDPIAGMLAGSVRVNGFLKEPQGDGTFDIQHPSAYGEKADHLRASVHITPDLAEVDRRPSGRWFGASAFFGSYRHPAGKWDSGDVRFQVTGQDLRRIALRRRRKLQPPMGGNFSGTLDGAGRVQNSKLELTSANGSLSVDKFTVDKQPVGNLKLTASTRGEDLQLQVNGTVRDSTVDGQGSWRLTGNDPGSMTVHFTRMDIQTVNHLAMLGTTAEQETRNFLLTDSSWAARHRRWRWPRRWTSRPRSRWIAVQLRPKPSADSQGHGAGESRIAQHQAGIAGDYFQGRHHPSAEFTAEGTTIEASGSVPFESGANANLALRGDLNLTILQLLSPDLTATGNATMQATIRGALRDPVGKWTAGIEGSVALLWRPA